MALSRVSTIMMRWAPREKATAAVVKARKTSMITVVPTAAAAPLVKLATRISISPPVATLDVSVAWRVSCGQLQEVGWFHTKGLNQRPNDLQAGVKVTLFNPTMMALAYFRFVGKSSTGSSPQPTKHWARNRCRCFRLD